MTLEATIEKFEPETATRVNELVSETATTRQEYKRFRAWELYQEGMTMEKIAHIFSVTTGAVSQWCTEARKNGVESLRSQPRPGAPKKLDDEQRQELKEIISNDSAEAHGFQGEVWNCPRVARLIESQFHINYHPAHVSRILKELDLTPQMPQKKKLKQNPNEVKTWWDTRWPELQKKAEEEKRKIVWVDESGFYLLPMLVKTYAPKGETPEIGEFDAYQHLSVISALTTDGKLYMNTREDAFDSKGVIQFLEHLYANIGQNLIVIWDGATIHRSHELKQFLKEQNHGKIHLEKLPAYSPELDPDEGVWNYLKRVELKNHSYLSLKELKKAIHHAFNHLRTKKDILLNLIHHSGYDV